MSSLDHSRIQLKEWVEEVVTARASAQQPKQGLPMPHPRSSTCELLQEMAHRSQRVTGGGSMLVAGRVR